MIPALENKCAMCGKYVFVSEGLDKENERNRQLEDSAALPTVVVEQIDGSQYTFDNASLRINVQKIQRCVWK